MTSIPFGTDSSDEDTLRQQILDMEYEGSPLPEPRESQLNERVPRGSVFVPWGPLENPETSGFRRRGKAGFAR
jgi:hypothetical protein